MSRAEGQEVAKRRVFYIPGYDPIHPRRYRELYRSEVAKQGEISDYEAELTPRKGTDSYGWHVDMDIDEEQVSAEFEVLVWSDIVRDSMSHSMISTYGQMLRTSWTYIRSGALRRLMWLRKGPVIAALYPVGMLILQLLIALLIGLGLGWTATYVLGIAFKGFAAMLTAMGVGTGTDLSDYVVFSFVIYVVKFALQCMAVVWVLRWFRSKDNKFFAHYLMHDYAYTAQLNGANPPELEARLAQFGRRISAALSDPELDEVLVVGHSSGAHLAISVIADLIRAGAVRHDGPKLGFLSLGQVVPMVSFLPEATRLRADLAYLSMRQEVTWVDVTAPGDGCSFALCDPVAVSGVRPEGARWPVVLSAAFSQTLQPKTWKELRWRFFRLHFQYLCHFDNPGDYDYFQITAGPRTLADRYGGRASSKSRIDVAASKYTSTGIAAVGSPAE